MYGRVWVGRYQQKNVDLVWSILTFWCLVTVSVTVGREIWKYHFFPLASDIPWWVDDFHRRQKINKDN